VEVKSVVGCRPVAVHRNRARDQAGIGRCSGVSAIVACLPYGLQSLVNGVGTNRQAA
jgi:hypothetical protein